MSDNNETLYVCKYVKSKDDEDILECRPYLKENAAKDNPTHEEVDKPKSNETRETSNSEETIPAGVGNQQCGKCSFVYQDVEYAVYAKYDAMPSTGDTLVIGDIILTFTNVTVDGTCFDWTASKPGIVSIGVKGGTFCHNYYYDGGQISDSDVCTAINPVNGKHFAISHVEVCVDTRIEILNDVHVGVSADASYTRQYSWVVNKTTTTPNVNVNLNTPVTLHYNVSAIPTSTDTDFKVTGTITIDNTSTKDLILENLVLESFPSADSLEIDGFPLLPKTLNSNSTTTWTYTALYQTKPEGYIKLTADIQYGGLTKITSIEAEFTFGEPSTTTGIPVTINDSIIGLLGVFPVNTPLELGYNREVTYNECGTYTINNTATATWNTTAGNNSSSSTATSIITVEGCDNVNNCTHTIGYWATHSKYGPASKPDDAWNLIPGSLGPDTQFYTSGITWIKVLTSAVRGSKYMILAKQFIAATLNKLGGANTSIIDAILAESHAYFSGTLVLPDSKLTAYASILDNYNNGIIGPGHCD